ncbi:MAG TPA: phospholipase D-like domain-containing protein [Gemmatimonadales bacterium]|nr:phospholipase D-like domain-containing protein [Gemmatimonadales bacterium]
MTEPETGRALESIARALNRAAGSRPIPGNNVSLLIDGPDAYQAMLDVIDRSEQWVHFENYIIRDDEAGQLFADHLIARARAGVHVRVLYDWLGSFGTSRRFWRQLRNAGVEVHRFHPPRLADIVTNFSRNHRKLVVADGRDAVVGGLCIGCEWTSDTRSGRQPWRDTAVRIAGPAAAALDQAFAEVWAVAGGVLPAADQVGSVPPVGPAAVRVVSGVPGRERTYRLIELLAAGAVERLWITDAYLVAPQRLIMALREAALDGVDVRLLVPGSSDLPLVRNLTRIGYRTLLRAGVRIFEWDGPMLHAKTMVSDHRWVRVGSSNLNPSSLVGNYELDVLVEDLDLAEEMQQQFRRDIASSREVIRRPVRVSPRISRVFPTVLDRQDPDQPGAHRRDRRELGRRAALVLRTLAGQARRSVFGPVMVILIVLSGLFLLLPRMTAYVFAAICTWLAIGAGREAFRRRADR